MKTIDLTKKSLSIQDLLIEARKGSVLLLDEVGEQFLLSHTDNFVLEVELLRKNHKFLAFLESCKAEDETLSLEEVEKILR